MNDLEVVYVDGITIQRADYRASVGTTQDTFACAFCGATKDFLEEYAGTLEVAQSRKLFCVECAGKLGAVLLGQ